MRKCEPSSKVRIIRKIHYDTVNIKQTGDMEKGNKTWAITRRNIFSFEVIRQVTSQKNLLTNRRESQEWNRSTEEGKMSLNKTGKVWAERKALKKVPHTWSDGK